MKTESILIILIIMGMCIFTYFILLPAITNGINNEINTDHDPALKALARDSNTIYACQNEFWMNASVSKIVQEGNLGVIKNISPLYQVCYFRDGTTTRTYLGEYDNPTVAMARSSWMFGRDVNYFTIKGG